MSVTVLAPTPALPPIRRASVWDKMFGNFKLGKDEEAQLDALLSPTIGVQKTRLASTSTAVDHKNDLYKRSASVSAQVTKDIRSSSAPTPGSPSNVRTSLANRRSSRMSGRRTSFFRSANPDTDSDVPALPQRKFSLFGSHNPDVELEETTVAPPISRRPSYVPRNAASSFLRTTTPLSADEKAEVSRRASVADNRSPTLNASVRSKSLAVPVNASVRSKSFAVPVNSYVAPKAIRPASLHFHKSPSAHGMHSMEGVCEIEDPFDDLISPRGGTFSAASAPLSPADTIMEEHNESLNDSAKASPELVATKMKSTVAVVELPC